MDVLGAKHLRVNQLPPAELEELKICPGTPAAPPCVLTSLRHSLAGPLNQSEGRASLQQHRTKALAGRTCDYDVTVLYVTESSAYALRTTRKQGKGVHWKAPCFWRTACKEPTASWCSINSRIEPSEGKFPSRSVSTSRHQIVLSQSGVIPAKLSYMAMRFLGHGCVIKDMNICHHTWHIRQKWIRLRVDDEANKVSVFRTGRRFDPYDYHSRPWLPLKTLDMFCMYGFIFF